MNNPLEQRVFTPKTFLEEVGKLGPSDNLFHANLRAIAEWVREYQSLKQERSRVGVFVHGLKAREHCCKPNLQECLALIMAEAGNLARASRVTDKAQRDRLVLECLREISVLASGYADYLQPSTTVFKEHDRVTLGHPNVTGTIVHTWPNGDLEVEVGHEIVTIPVEALFTVNHVEE